MIPGVEGTALGALLNAAKPSFLWDATKAGTALGTGIAGDGNMLVTITNEDAQTITGWSHNIWDPSLNQIRTISLDTDADKLLGPCGEFTEGLLTNSMGSVLATAKHGFAVVTPTVSGALIEHATDYPDILYNGSTWHCKVTQLDTTLDAVNAVVIEKSQARSSSFIRCFQLLIRNDNGVTSPDGNIELGWNTTAGTRTTSVPVFRQLPTSPVDRGWYSATIAVPLDVVTAGYISVKAAADSGIWHIAYPQWYSKGASMERVTRLAGPVNSTDPRGQWQVHTTNAELRLGSAGWLAASFVLPDPSISNGHVDYTDAGNYKFLGMLNLDCGLYRMRLSMSDTYDHPVVSLGTTAGVNFAYLDFPTAWESFHAFGMVCMWEISNGSLYAILYVNGVKVDSAVDPIDWFPATLAPGTLYVGTSGAAGTSAEAWISRVAYGRNRIGRTQARILSRHLQKLARGTGIEV